MSQLPGVLADLGVHDPVGIDVSGDPQPAVLASPLAVAECATAAVSACLVAAADLALARTGKRPEVELDVAHVAAAVRSEAWLRDPAGESSGGFAALSGLWRAADGWVRTHANYRWHRAALLAGLGVADGRNRDVRGPVADAIARRAAHDVERSVYAAGGLAVAARTATQWRVDRPADGSPLVAMAPLGAGEPKSTVDSAGLPAAGIRVLDLTRVIAGPVGTRMLGALGADVLRIDDPRRPELPRQDIEGVLGKASALLDASTGAGLATLHRLVEEADVLVTGYRPGALHRLGLDPDQVADRHPGTVVVTLSAWGTAGAADEWSSRRGFDSLVQIASGIGWAVSTDGERPGALPCQLLDHGTGYLIAAGALAALARRCRTGEATHVELSLERTARWLLDQGSRPNTGDMGARQARAGDTGARQAGPDGAYRVDFGDGWSGISPPGRLDGRSLTWPHLPPRYGQARIGWR